MRKSFYLIVLFTIYFFQNTNAQESISELKKPIRLSEIVITETNQIGSIERMPDIKENIICAGKKNEVLILNKLNADLSTNNTRQVFAKVPGMSIWENDGSGIQVGVASRGLSPNRSWEFNVRQNGYDISSEVYGYPESYYAPPMEALSKIEVIRGAASLQYGPQFGGVLNYQIKKGNPYKPLTFETQQTIGSYGLFNTYMGIGGTYKKVSYYGFLHHRNADGWRDNSKYNIYTAYLSINYQVSKKINLGVEYTNMNYKSQQPGGLTDIAFEENHRQSFRERNWFGAPWNVASLVLKYDVSKSINLQIKSFATIAERNSVGFTKSITTKDTINAATLNYNERQVDRDEYNNYGAEARVSVKYKLLNKENTLAAGIRIYSGSTQRNQLGIGTTNSNFDLTMTNPQYGKSLNFKTINYAVFAENIFQIGSRLKLIPGIRIEFIENRIDGYINTTQQGIITPDSRDRKLLLYGLGSELMVSKNTNVYCNYSLAYRPVTFSELTPSATTEIIDANLKDASGYNFDLGYRGTINSFLNFDVGVFYLLYENRIGTITQNGTPFKTNIGTSVSKGIESYIEIDVVKIFSDKSKIGSISIYASNAFIDAKYTEWNNPDIISDPTKSIKNKRVENAPNYIHRFGANYMLKGLSANFQLSNVGNVFTDAANTETANATGTIGKLSGYQIMDASISYKLKENYSFKIGANNLADEKYATRRATGYPGPGILPGNGRTFYFTVGATF
jgi:Fe(3+) dicitrate transport protein